MCVHDAIGISSAFSKGRVVSQMAYIASFEHGASAPAPLCEGVGRGMMLC